MTELANLGRARPLLTPEEPVVTAHHKIKARYTPGHRPGEPPSHSNAYPAKTS